MNRHSQRGVALVITLVMLAIVTFMAVVFLATSRRERASVTVSANQTDAKYMADSALARAQAEIASRILSTTNPYNYDLIVSTNYYNPLGFRPDDTPNPVNVNFYQRTGSGASPDFKDYIHNLANLQYDPRPPVFVPTNASGDSEFRFYLDLNRNGYFEPNGQAPVISDAGAFYDLDGNPISSQAPGNTLSNFFVGDPEWIGVLQRPDRPHSESNQFIGRYAFIVLPAGKSLDLNYIHNDVKRPEGRKVQDGYMRNHGFGSWELNLAGFLRDLNTNVWGYSYNPNRNAFSTGLAFTDALSILQHRYEFDDARNEDRRPDRIFGFAPSNPFVLDGLDNRGDGPLLLAGGKLTLDSTPDRVDLPWGGGGNINNFVDVQDLFSLNQRLGSVQSQNLVRDLNLMTMTNMVNRNKLGGTYNRYSYYRMLAQMGVDSLPADTVELFDGNFRKTRVQKMHLNYRDSAPNRIQQRDYQTNFVSWEPALVTAAGNDNPLAFFLQAGSRLLRASMETNRSIVAGAPRLHYSLGARFEGLNTVPLPAPVRQDFGIGNIQVFHAYNDEVLRPSFAADVTPETARLVANFEYSAAVHRCLQLAANIYDATTHRTHRIGTNEVEFPTVFRPIFKRTRTNIVISGFLEVTNTAPLAHEWVTLRDMYLRFGEGAEIAAVNAYGIPWVVGAKKGIPNFNEYVLETEVALNRKLELRRPNLTSRPTQTNQMYSLGIRAMAGFEGWNSYTNDFQRNVEVRFTNQYSAFLLDRPEGSSLDQTKQSFPPVLLGANIVTNNWHGNSNILGRMESFISAAFTNVLRPFLSYHTRPGPAGQRFEASYDVPDLSLVLSNRLQYALIDRDLNRVLDFVNLDQMVMSNRISDYITLPIPGSGSASGLFGNNAGSSQALDLFNRTRTGGAGSPTQGVLNQIAISAGIFPVGSGTWDNYSAVPINDVTMGTNGFNRFLNGSDRSDLARQTPFNPDVIVRTNIILQVNDPLVHYTLEDLSAARLNRLRPSVAAMDTNAIPLNQAYQPWGGNPNNPNPDTAFHVYFKDPLIHRSDDWDFPMSRLPNIGWLGRVHRGTPWQTMYLKSSVELNATDRPDLWHQLANRPEPWYFWSGSAGTHPTNDWRLLDVFTVAPNANATRGLLSVNQTNQAAWSAVLSGVAVTTNTTPASDLRFGGGRVVPRVDDYFIEPASAQLREIVQGIVHTRIHNTNANRMTPSFQSMGEILTVPELTLRSPFLNVQRETGNYVATNNFYRMVHDDPLRQRGISDSDYERIPQQIMSLLKSDEPRFVVYAFGQSLRPAERSVATAHGVFNICTNYQITGEVFSKAVMRLQDVPPPANATPAQLLGYPKSRVVVESFNLLPPE